MHISWVAKPRMNYTYSPFTIWNKWYILSKNLNFLFIIYNFKRDTFLYFRHMTSYMFAYNVILMMTLHNVPCRPKPETTGASGNLSKFGQFYNQNFPCDLVKRMNIPHFVILSTDKKIKGAWKSEVGSRKQMEKAENIQFHPWNTTYIFTAVKYHFFIFSQLWNITFFSNLHYHLINLFLYFIT